MNVNLRVCELFFVRSLTRTHIHSCRVKDTKQHFLNSVCVVVVGVNIDDVVTLSSDVYCRLSENIISFDRDFVSRDEEIVYDPHFRNSCRTNCKKERRRGEK